MANCRGKELEPKADSSLLIGYLFNLLLGSLAVTTIEIGAIGLHSGFIAVDLDVSRLVGSSAQIQYLVLVVVDALLCRKGGIFPVVMI